jgi:NO-binding membrane sensor protein with MHYT domain
MTGDTSSRQDRATPVGRALLALLAGPLVWALHFSVVYGAHAILCAREFPKPVAVWSVLIATVVAVAALVAIGMRSVPAETASEQGFRRSVSALLLVLSMVGVVWAGATVAFVPVCEPLR